MGYRKSPFPDHFEQAKKYRNQHKNTGYRSDPSNEPIAKRELCTDT